MSKHAKAVARTGARTFIQALIPAVLLLGVIVPQIVDIVLGDMGALLPESWKTWLLAGSAAVAAIAAALAKIMAIPAVNDLLTRYGLGNGNTMEDTE